MSVEHRNYHTIDGIRGAAAVVVLVFHSSKFLGLPSAEGSYLAVDLFFALSGFILTHAYGRKFDEGLGLAEFMKIRWIRLYPLYFLSGVLGAIKLYRFYNPHGAASALAVTAGSLLGFPNTLPMRDADLYLTNVPAWSLLLEVCANLLLVAIWKKLSNPLLALLIIVGFAGLVFTVWRYGTLNVGFRWPGLADGGGSRVLFSFFAGVAIYRARIKVPILNPWLILVMTLFVLLVPLPVLVRPFYDLAAIVLGVPAIVALSCATEPSPSTARLFAFSGVTSYAVYVIHYPLLDYLYWIQWRIKLPLISAEVLFVLAVVGISWVADRIFDQPIRRALTRSILLKRRGVSPESSRQP